MLKLKVAAIKAAAIAFLDDFGMTHSFHGIAKLPTLNGCTKGWALPSIKTFVSQTAAGLGSDI
jgi:hypothetical protein